MEINIYAHIIFIYHVKLLNNKGILKYFVLLGHISYFRNPTTYPVTNPSGNEFTWKKLTSNDLYYAYLIVDTKLKKDYRQKDYAFWSYLFKGIMNGTRCDQFY